MSPARRYALDVTAMLHRRTGIGRYVEELAAGFADSLEDDEELVLFAGTFRRNPLLGDSHEPLHRLTANPRVSLRRLWLPFRVLEPGWRLLGFPSISRLAGRLDVVHGTNFRLPPPGGAARGIVTVHDLAVMRFPETVQPSFRRWFERTVRESVRCADIVVADSEATRQDVIELLGADPARVETVLLGVDYEAFAEGDVEADRARLRESCGLGGPFVLFVGSAFPRKNLPRVLDAFARVAADGRPHRLVLAGSATFANDEISAAIGRAGVADRVLRPGYLPEEDVRALYRAADAFVFPSLYEGFGLPVLEAMAAGCPIVTSNVSSLPEVAGDAALLVEPTDTDAIEDALARVLGDAALREGLVARGRARARQFTWERTVERTVALHRRLADFK